MPFPSSTASRRPRALRPPLAPRNHRWPALAVLSVGFFEAQNAAAAPPILSLQDYRAFRSLSVDLQGRLPTLSELDARESSGFSLAGFVDERLQAGTYASTLRRVYMDRLRLDLSSAFQYVPGANTLRRYAVTTESGASVPVYFRAGQRRQRPETDGVFCLTEAESGLRFPPNAAAVGTAKPVSQAALDAATVLVKPWWLYRDYTTASPTQRFGSNWPASTANFLPAPLLLKENGATDTTVVRVCREEAQATPTGPVMLTRRTPVASGISPPFGRYSQLPLDSAYATAHPTEVLDCTSGLALPNSSACGCGQGLERCIPGTTYNNDPPGFVLPTNSVLGEHMPLGTATGSRSSWSRYWWGEEAAQFLERSFGEDRDVRSLLVGKGTWVNGPLAAFYKFGAGVSWGTGREQAFAYTSPLPVIEPSALPSLAIHDTDSWLPITDRGPNAAGLLTMPIFLTKYATRRARAHAVYQAFLCKDFVAANVALSPSEDPDLAKRPGCSGCHTILEPMSAYFARNVESTWTWLPISNFPVDAPMCRKQGNGSVNASCPTFYDSSFATTSSSFLKGAYGSPANADRGPAGLGADVAASPDFARCVVSTVADALMPGGLGEGDSLASASFTKTFVENGYRIRPLLRAMFTSDIYRSTSNLSSAAWRAAEAP